MCPWSFPAAFPFVSEFIGTMGRHSWGTVIVWSFSDPKEMWAVEDREKSAGLLLNIYSAVLSGAG